ncbi:MAG: OmpA family protein [Bacteroidetes bacterium]|nr:OmpA family protein [Bacteroidota bacterium]
MTSNKNKVSQKPSLWEGWVGFLLLISLLTQHALFAQQDLTLYNIEVVPQRMYANPAFKPAYSSVNIGLPLISSQYFNFGSSGFKYSDLIRHRADDSLYVDVDNLIKKLGKKNYFIAAYRTDLLSFGFQVKKNYFSFNATEKVDSRFRYTKDLMELFWKGNGALMDKDLNLGFGLNLSHYREDGFGFARQINDKLTIGGKLKYLYGMENVWTEKSDVTLNTDSKYFAMTAKSNVIINTSIDTNAFNNFSVANYVFKKKNSGMGIDLGGVYKYDDKITLSASVVDLGFIRWKDSTTNYESRNPEGSFTYQGIDLEQFIKDPLLTIGDAMNKTRDSVTKALKIDTLHHSYTTWLSTQIYLGANYVVTEKSNAGFLFYSQIFDKAIHPGVALSYNQRLGRWLAASASYSIYNRSFTNVGLGLALNGGPLQLYIVSDNIFGGILAKVGDQLYHVVPIYAKNANIHFGINLTFGRKSLDKDKDGIPDKDDACPDIKGLKEFKGCPDRDGDHIPDNMDECPDQPGLPQFNGCPDRDSDGIIDKNDSCPDVAGTVQFNGCPDQDGDGIIDIKDSCPDVPGVPEFNGCPDRDGDKIIDKLDSCPDEAGLPKLNGCPDKDGDGIIDKHDLCPNEPGSAETFGCPDKDGDGVVDKEDRCPDKAGPKENDGCPLARLHLIDEKGNIIATAVIGKDGKFNFAKLPTDERVLLKLESYDVLMVNEIAVESGTLVHMARRGVDGYFRFDKLSAEENKVGKLDMPDIQIRLKAEEALTVKSAMENLEFDYGKAGIRTTSNTGLDQLTDLMKKNPTWRLKLSGHTDNVSSLKFNMELSKKRVESVKKYLVSKGISEQRVILKWYGPNKPIAPNTTEEGKQKNRRVEFLIIQ